MLVSTSTLGGHVNTIPNQVADGRRRRRLHSDEFKANAVASCMQPGMSMASVAMANGINANLLRRWVREAELGRTAARPDGRNRSGGSRTMSRQRPGAGRQTP